MSVQPIEFTPTAKDLPSRRGPGEGNYLEIEVPGDYEVLLTAVDSYDKTDKGKGKGWVFTYACETPSGGSVNFNLYLSFGADARWKIVEVFDAHGDSSEGDIKRQFDPNKILNTAVGAHIDFDRDKATNEPKNNYRGIQRVFPLPDDEDIQAILDTPAPDLDEVPFVTEQEDLSAEAPIQL